MNKNLIILVVVVSVIFGGFYFSSQVNLQNVNKNNNDQKIENKILSQNTNNSENLEQVEFTLDAERWNYSPSVINVKKGQRVKIAINNADTRHGINLPDFNASGENSIEFIADKTGEFTFYCDIYCGQGHKDMKGKIIVLE